MAAKKIGLIIGSAREGSMSKAVGEALKGVVPANLELVPVDISALPIYNEDLDAEPVLPASWKAFREEIKGLDGVVFVMPEYNRGLPPLLKNAVDVGSRPYGYNAWDGKPGAVVTISPGALGGFGANHQLRQSMVFLNMPVMQQPEAYIGSVYTLFDEAGNMNADTLEFLKVFMESYAAFAGKLI